ncbi:Uncharacterised protein [Vibrio cholerae]|nr:Uncharacterised protein [Vibrio cholerae]CSI56062.1 Uncharacterised protein [Vibrio cholerae]
MHIIVANQGKIVRHSQTSLASGLNHAHRHHVIGNKQSTGQFATLIEFFKGLVTTFTLEVRFHNPIWINGNSRFRERTFVTFITHLCLVANQRTCDTTNLFMPTLNQMLGRHVATLQ